MSEPLPHVDLMPAPGNYKTPVMHSVRISSTDDPKVIQLIFQTEKQFAGQTERLTIAVPIPALDAAGLLESLLKLRQSGLIPTISVSSPRGPAN